MLRVFHEEVSVLDSTYKGWLAQGAVIGLNARRKVAINDEGYDGKKIEISWSGMLHSRVPCVPTDMQPFVGKIAVAVREEDRVHDGYAIAILEGNTYCR